MMHHYGLVGQRNVGSVSQQSARHVWIYIRLCRASYVEWTTMSSESRAAVAVTGVAADRPAAARQSTHDIQLYAAGHHMRLAVPHGELRARRRG